MSALAITSIDFDSLNAQDRKAHIQDLKTKLVRLTSESGFDQFAHLLSTAKILCPDFLLECEYQLADSAVEAFKKSSYQYTKMDKLKYVSPSDSLIRSMGECYPEDTCPHIDSAQESLRKTLSTLNNAINDVNSKLNSNKLSDSAITEIKNKFELDYYSDFDDSQDLVDVLVDEIDHGEEIRENAIQVRERLRVMSNKIKSSLLIFNHDNKIVAHYEPIDLRKDVLSIKNLKPQSMDEYYAAIENFDMFSSAAESLADLAINKDEVLNVLCPYADYLSIESYIEHFFYL